MSRSLALALLLLSTLSSATNPSIYAYRSGTCSNPAIRVCPGINPDACCDFPFSPGNQNHAVSSTMITSLADCDVFSWHRQGTGSVSGGGNSCGPIRDSAAGPGRRVCLEYRGNIQLNYETGGGAMWKDLSHQYPPGCPQIKFPNVYPNYLNIYGVSRRAVNTHGKVTDAPDVPVAELGGCKSREIPTVMEWQPEGHGVWVLEKLSPERYKAFNEMPSANVVDAIENMKKFNAVFFEHWSQHPTAHEAMTHAICASSLSQKPLSDIC